MSKLLTATKLPTFSRVKREDGVLPKGTILFHYALSGDKEEIERYETSRGANLRNVEEGEHKGAPMWFTSQILPDKLQVRIAENGNINVNETIEEATSKAQLAKDQIAKEKELEKKMAMAAKYGLTVSL